MRRDTAFSVSHTLFHPSILYMSTHRIHGLETLRALAIVMVLAYHYSCFISHRDTFGFLSQIGWAGVDLFFMLSGYLIGNQLLANVAHGRPVPLKRFIFRRLMRTLPNYWVVVASFFLLPALCAGASLPPLWKFLTFTQNLGLRPGTAFSHAWSLCVEEQFYLALPLLIMLFARATRPGRCYAVMLGTMLVAGPVLRWVLWHRVTQHGVTDPFAFWQYIYFSTACRCDELLMGVGVALIRNFQPRIWQRVLAHGQLTLALGVAVTALTLKGLQHQEDNLTLWWTVFGYPALGLGFALLLASALSPNSWLHRCRIPGAATLAAWSFALYLTHKQLWIVLAPVLQAHGYLAEQPATIAMLLVVALVQAYLLYTLIERPFLAWRDRYSRVKVRQDLGGGVRDAAEPALTRPAARAELGLD